jgi:hypothetical protein
MVRRCPSKEIIVTARVPNGREIGRLTEHQQSVDRLGPRGIDGAPDPAKMTPERLKKTPIVPPDDDGHTA